ncbi:hypothetical protein F4776DRAFT_669183 [Hypoxylon sp. NC0597]|nr:hypothetical protein F4776DRAFT_669183 [Hypoxylon sp. NC0597]
MTSHSPFERLPPEIQLKIWVEYFKQIVIHTVGISKADEEYRDPIFLRAYAYTPIDPSQRPVSLRLVRGAIFVNRMCYQLFKACHHILDLEFQRPQHGRNIFQIPLNIDGDLVYITNLHSVLLGKLCSPSGPCSGKIKRVALLFSRETTEIGFSLPDWGHYQRNAATSGVALEEVLIVMAASRHVVPMDQLLLGRRDEYGFVEFGTASLPSLASWEIRLAEFFFRKSEESLKKAKFPLLEPVKIRRVIDINA